MLQAPPLSLYVHIPWCIQKCPYCDFNSHGVKSDIPESVYTQHLLDDLATDAQLVGDREVKTIFIGGGTPSLFTPEAINNLLTGIASRVNLASDAEITMEANPGTFEQSRFEGFKDAGVNRLSIGVQSFQEAKLTALGRVHGQSEAVEAGRSASVLGLNSFNLDLMHGLPEQTEQDALSDLSQAISLAPPHISWYQLTIEPNTLFHSKPPVLPEDEVLWDIQESGQNVLKENGYEQYEISAYSKRGHQCQHNLNYWRFGDYLGIGCGAHGKITLEDKVLRTTKVKHPKGYMDLTQSYMHKQWQVAEDEIGFEYFMNRLRLVEPCPKQEMERYTGLSLHHQSIATAIESGVQRGLLIDTRDCWQVSDLGKRYLNELLSSFL